MKQKEGFNELTSVLADVIRTAFTYTTAITWVALLLHVSVRIPDGNGTFNLIVISLVLFIVGIFARWLDVRVNGGK